ncbi:hypothetical protein CNEO3_90055 [Clostridium neonatale]|uniref:Uncharacterized protein n=1 Tax=Clostridium neonatale TaxID=137838 RepID=A0AA86MQA2_9CLOT|nr:hypothetical protein CNEO_44581 [Clostridium neonatale]CAI3556067.1 hypothetical protein CNEO3_110037 [Clostridium neonatale]CAI3556081.1 hypothetical protein CNEO4_1200027 [Clostridium neonatale]CAI3558609.1 hypothetical protein CNEO3_100054 [Clostridium neonatale]CAI3585516.1 hypothetical protein CNEO3_130054 [Clostridium neonatale]
MKDKKNICIIEDKYIVWNQNLVDNNRNPIYDMLDCREISSKNSTGRGCTQKCLLHKASF